MHRIILILLALATTPAWAQLRFDILRATYGQGSNVVDVTARLKSFIVDNGINIQVTGESMGVDPAPNTPKTLTVDYRQGVIPRRIQIKDFDYLRLGSMSAAQVPTLRITRAQYGEGNRMKDVSDLLTSRVANNRLELVIDNVSMGGDPAPAVKKALNLEYTFGAANYKATFKEGETLRLPDANVPVSAQPTSPSGNFRIVKATYGEGSSTRDVTTMLVARTSNGALQMDATNASLGGDPAPARKKALIIDYEYQGRTQQARFNENDVIRLPDAPLLADNPNQQPILSKTTLRIVRAMYGDGRGNSMDVTSAVQQRMANGQVNLVVNGENLGGDPAPGVVKQVFVDYEVNGMRSTVTAQDGEVLRIPFDSGYNVQSIRIGPKKPIAEGAFEGACFFKDKNFGGESYCVRTGEDVTAFDPNRPNGFQSMRFLGRVTSVEIFETNNFGGRRVMFNGDQPDLLRAGGSWWRYDRIANLSSLRVR